MLFIVWVQGYGSGAANKGIIGSRSMAPGARCELFHFEAGSVEAAYRYLCENFQAADGRPLSGKSYLKPSRLIVGQQVSLLRGYPVGFYGDGRRKLALFGRISEVLAEGVDGSVSVEFDGYHTRFVDFSVRELSSCGSSRAIKVDARTVGFKAGV